MEKSIIATTFVNRTEMSALSVISKNCGGDILKDSEITELLKKRDEAALKAISRKYGGLCAMVAKNILQNPQDVEECVNDTFMKIWESVPPAEPRILSAFLAKITKNIALNKYKLNRREKRGGGEMPLVFEELEEFIFDSKSVEAETERREILSAINDFLSKLSSKKRIIFVRRYWYCDSIPELTKRFEMSESSVSATLSRIRTDLKKYLKKRGF